MERVTLLVEETGAQVSCLLNPSSLSFTRDAGLVPRRSIASQLTGLPPASSASQLIYTGDDITELELDLLFDTDFQDTPPGSESQKTDVRQLTSTIWSLSDANTGQSDRTAEPPLFYVIWGRATKLRCVVLAISEKIERFDEVGIPQRSWLSMRVRVLQAEESDPRGYIPLPAPVPLPGVGMGVEGTLADDAPAPPPPPDDMLLDRVASLILVGGERLESIAAKYLGNSALWRWLALTNNITDPLRLEPGTVLDLTPPPGGQGGSTP